VAVGAHCLGYNDCSIGICLIGTKFFPPSQIGSALALCRDLMVRYGIGVDDVMGHCETASGKEQGKTCPNINMDAFREWLK